MNPSINEQGNVDSSNVLRIDIFFYRNSIKDRYDETRSRVDTAPKKPRRYTRFSIVITLCRVEEHCAHFWSEEDEDSHHLCQKSTSEICQTYNCSLEQTNTCECDTSKKMWDEANQE